MNVIGTVHSILFYVRPYLGINPRAHKDLRASQEVSLNVWYPSSLTLVLRTVAGTARCCVLAFAGPRSHRLTSKLSFPRTSDRRIGGCEKVALTVSSCNVSICVPYMRIGAVGPLEQFVGLLRKKRKKVMCVVSCGVAVVVGCVVCCVRQSVWWWRFFACRCRCLRDLRLVVGGGG